MEGERVPVWGIREISGSLSGRCFLLLMAVAAGVVRHFLLASRADTLGRSSSFRCIFYVLLLVVLLVMLLAWKYQAPFWSSLGVNFRFRFPTMWLALGPVLSVAVSSFALLLKPPAIESPIEELILDKRALILVVFLGPLFEEIVFRGFLFPLFARSIGPWLAIVATAIPFAQVATHGSQSEWAWQLLVPIGLAGVVFGWVRYKTGSTAASTLVHMGYNTTAVVAYLVQKN